LLQFLGYGTKESSVFPSQIPPEGFVVVEASEVVVPKPGVEDSGSVVVESVEGSVGVSKDDSVVDSVDDSVDGSVVDSGVDSGVDSVVDNVEDTVVSSVVDIVEDSFVGSDVLEDVSSPFGVVVD